MLDVERITWTHQAARRQQEELDRMDKKPKINIGMAGCYGLMGAAFTVSACTFAMHRPVAGLALLACAVFFAGVAQIFSD
jgi:succinate-acetate transporter protein